MNRYSYPLEWEAIARAVKQTCDWQCLQCDRQCRRPGEFYLGWRDTLTCAHITQDYDAPVVLVACLCTLCHLKHDAPLVWVARRRAQRWRMQRAGQLELFA